MIKPPHYAVIVTGALFALWLGIMLSVSSTPNPTPSPTERPTDFGAVTHSTQLGIRFRDLTTHPAPDFHERGMPAPSSGSPQHTRICNGGVWPAPINRPKLVLECNSNTDNWGNPMSFRDVFDCETPVEIAPGACEEMIYVDRWVSQSTLLKRYPHARSLPAALEVGHTSVLDLDRTHAGVDVDYCETCELWNAPKSCYRAVIEDPRGHRLIYVPCRGEPRTEPF